jgi:mono/diheme cytochrome c family protein
MIKKAFLVLVAVFLIIQLIRPAKNLSPAPDPQDITTKVAVPAEVQRVFSKACYDCHSDHTRYPWYAEVEPVGWWLASHIHDGKRHLNFSEFGAFNAKAAERKLKQIARNVDNRAMPLPSYTWIHRDAILTDAEIKLIDDWVEAARTQIAPKPPAK